MGAIVATELVFPALNHAGAIWLFVDVRRHSDAGLAAVVQTRCTWTARSIVATFIGGRIIALAGYLVTRRPRPLSGRPSPARRFAAGPSDRVR